ncbi:MAG: A/G-specific adenine glycosylase [Alphaproteobacteria bacterium]
MTLSPSKVVRDLLKWYDGAARELPWRAPPGASSVPVDPYRVWLSEIMLQQTTVKAVIPYFQAFVARWPTVDALARADLNDVLAAWAGLGYYSRARNLHACAREVATQHDGRFPADETALHTLPGIGPYTAAAIAAIAFGLPATVVDGNVERVVARLFAVKAPLPGAKAELRRLAAELTPRKRPGDFAQAMMDLGASICAPRTPLCAECPLARHCAAYAQGIAAALPARSPKPERPVRIGVAFVAIREDGAVLLRRRPPKGLLGGMLETPGTEWTEMPTEPADALSQTPLAGAWRLMPGEVTHTFTHFHLRLSVYRADALPQHTPAPQSCQWMPRNRLDGEALPSVMQKVLARALSAKA